MKPIAIIIVLGFFLNHCGLAPTPQTVTPLIQIHEEPSEDSASESLPPLQITVLNIGQGDATLVSTPGGHQILIDGGPSGSGKHITVPYLLENDVSEFDHLMASHFDADHIGGIAEILAGRDGMAGTPDDIRITGDCWDRGESDAKATPAFASYVKATAHCQRTAIPGDVLRFDDGVTIEVLAINGQSRFGILIDPAAQDENAASMALLIRHGEFRYLTTGDLPGGGGNPPYDTVDEESLLAPLVGHVDVVHLGHHGSQTSSNLKFLQALSPTAAVISVGDKNSYFHPHPSVLQRLRELGIPVYQTNRGHNVGTQDSHIVNGHIIVKSDGAGFEINGD